MYRGVSSIKDRVVQNILDPPVRPLFFHKLIGYYKCGRCWILFCQFNCHKPKTIVVFGSNTTIKTYTAKPLITCSTTHVVYLLQCPCGLQYVGRTTSALSIRLNEHISNITKGFKNHSVSRHYDLVHNRDPRGTLFVGIDHFVPHWRGRLKVRELSRMETKWIYILKSYIPHIYILIFFINFYCISALVLYGVPPAMFYFRGHYGHCDPLLKVGDSDYITFFLLVESDRSGNSPSKFFFKST